MRTLLPVILLLLCAAPICAQELEGEARNQFVAEQDVYLQNLQLSIDQRKAYQQITIQYEKLFQALARSGVSGSARKTQQKKLQKAKDADMRKVLNDSQYKMYTRRQKEIEKYYE